MRALLFLLALANVFAADPNTLTPQERASGWRLFVRWHELRRVEDPAKQTPSGDSWTIEDNCLVAKREPRVLEDLTTAERFRNYEFTFDQDRIRREQRHR